MNVLIADGHRVSHNGLRRQVQTCFIGSKISAATDLSSALDELETHYIDIVITDLNMRDSHGLHGLQQLCLHTHEQGGAVLLYTAKLYSQTLLREAQRLGIAGYLSKAETLERLRITLRGLRFAPQYPDLVIDPTPDDETRVGNLTPSEIQILHNLVDGLTLGEIASLRQRSLHTVQEQVKAIRRKLGTPALRDALVMYVRVRSRLGQRF